MTQADRVHSTPPTPAPRTISIELVLFTALLAMLAAPAVAVFSFLIGDAMARELTPQDVLEDLLGSDDFPVVIADTAAAAYLILRRLHDAGFVVLPSEDDRP